MKKTLFTAVLAATCIAFAPSVASAADACPDANPLTAPIVWYQGGENSRLSYQVSPSDAFSGANMGGKTVKLTITGKTKAKLPLAFFSYKTQSANIASAWPQELFDRDEVVLNGCETVELEVAVPNCHFQIDFVYMGPGHPGLNEFLKNRYPELLGDLPLLPPFPGLPDFKKLEPRPDGNTEQDVLDALYPNGGIINGNLGGSANCWTTTTTTTTTNTTPTLTTPTLTTPTPLTPVNRTTPVGGQGTTTTTAVKGIGSKRACSSVAATSYRARVGLTSSIVVRVKTTSKSRPTVLLKGGGLGKYNKKTRTYAGIKKRVNSKGTVTFKVKPRKAGRIRVTATGCAKVAGVSVGKKKRAATTNVAPTFTG